MLQAQEHTAVQASNVEVRFINKQTVYTCLPDTNSSGRDNRFVSSFNQDISRYCGIRTKDKNVTVKYLIFSHFPNLVNLAANIMYNVHIIRKFMINKIELMPKLY